MSTKPHLKMNGLGAGGGPRNAPNISETSPAQRRWRWTDATVGVGITRHSACQSTPELELPFGRMLRTLARPPPLIERTDGRQRTSKSGTLRRFFVSLVDGCLDCMINLPTVYTANRIVGRIRLSLTDPYFMHNGPLRFLKTVGSSSNEISKHHSIIRQSV